MDKLSTFKATLVAATLLALSPVHAATIGKADYQAGKDRIGVEYQADKAACSSLAANAKDICLQEAKGKDRVARAELEFRYTGKPADRTKVLVAKAESAYGVAKEKCDDLAGNDKDVCVKTAKAVEVKALADAKMGKEIGDARKDAAAEKLDADYQVAIQKCDALAGDAKGACVSAAKAKFGKM